MSLRDRAETLHLGCGAGAFCGLTSANGLGSNALEAGMALRRQRLIERRKALGYSQEALAEQISVDRCTVARWERGESEPQPYIRPKLARLLQVTPQELGALLVSSLSEGQAGSSVQAIPATDIVGQAVLGRTMDVDELDDMNRRELLRLLSVAGTLATLPHAGKASDDGRGALAEDSDIDQYELLNAHLWQVFALSTSKRLVYPLVRQQLRLLTDALERAHSEALHTRLCVLTGDLFQLAGEICFDSNQYTDAAYCYTLAANASKEAAGYDLWACALARHAFISIYERRFMNAIPMLDAASHIAARGDSQLSTRYWVAAVQAEAYAGLGDFDACTRALDTAEQVRGLQGAPAPGGWLRFDGSRLAEERGTCYIELGRPQLAETPLNEALGQSTSLRRRGSILNDLAMLGLQCHDVERAVHYGSMAVELAEQTGSAGYIGRKLQSLRIQLEPLMSNARVSGLSSQISHLTSNTA